MERSVIGEEKIIAKIAQLRQEISKLQKQQNNLYNVYRAELIKENESKIEVLKDLLK